MRHEEFMTVVVRQGFKYTSHAMCPLRGYHPSGFEG